MEIKNGNYFVVQSFMINDLKLKSGAERDIYAIIYGFSQDGTSKYTGSIAYLCTWCGISKSTVIRALQNLVEKEYIIKEDYEINNVHLCKYFANLELLKGISKSNILKKLENVVPCETIDKKEEDELGSSNLPLPNNADRVVSKQDTPYQNENKVVSNHDNGMLGLTPNKLENNNKKIYLNHSIKSKEGIGVDVLTENIEKVKDMIEYDYLSEFLDSSELEEIVNIIAEVLSTTNKKMTIAKELWDIEIVKSRYMQLRSNHIMYVMNCLYQSTTKISNIKQYIITTLFNAPTTINNYYKSLVNYDDKQALT